MEWHGLTSPRLRGEVGVCALIAQIPGAPPAARPPPPPSPRAVSGEFALAATPLTPTLSPQAGKGSRG
jgi:hypothetical protein